MSRVMLSTAEISMMHTMWQMQKELDAAFIGDKIVTKEQRVMALTDEIGEVLCEILKDEEIDG